MTDELWKVSHKSQQCFQLCEILNYFQTIKSENVEIYA